MKAAYFDGKALRLREDYPEPGDGEAVIRVDMAGICGTDLELLAGYMGFTGVPGHEFVGTVTESPDPAWTNKRVAGEINAACGACEMCKKGLGRHCPDRTVLGILDRDGAFAEYLSLPVANLHEIPGSLADEQAVFVEPVAAAFEIHEQIKIRPEWRIAVVGDGRLAQLVSQVLKITAPDITCFGHHAKKLWRLEGLGMQTAAEIAESDEHRFDLVVEATGSSTGFADASRLARPRGRIIMKSTTADAGGIDMTPAVINEITVTGSRCGPFRPAIEALASGAVSVEGMIDGTYSLSDIGQAVEHAGRPDALKILLRP